MLVLLVGRRLLATTLALDKEDGAVGAHHQSIRNAAPSGGRELIRGAVQLSKLQY